MLNGRRRMIGLRHGGTDGGADRFRQVHTTVRNALLLAALASGFGCGSPERGVAIPPADRIALPFTRDAAACLATAEGMSTHPAHPALILLCADLTDETALAHSMRQSALDRIVRASLSRESRAFAPVTLAANIRVNVDQLPLGSYFAVPEGGGDAGKLAIPGDGIPMVLSRPTTLIGPNQPPEGVVEPVAITVSVERSDDAVLVNLRAVEGTALRRGGWADAAGAAYLRLLGRAQLREEARDGFRTPDPNEFRQEGIYLIEPYDPGRIPILMIHGLRSSPQVWRVLTLSVLTDPDLHRRFQVWHAFYPTGLPPFYSAARVRRQLREVLATYDPQGRDLPSRRMAVIGHSMGGIVTRALVTNDAGLLWRTSFRIPPDALQVSPDDRAAFQSILTLTLEPQIGFAAFINTPHRGSRTAAGPIGRLGSALIRLPLSLTALFRTGGPFVAQMTDAMRPYLVDDFADSVRSLSPDHPLLVAMSGLAPAPGVRIASVIGVHGGQACLRNPSCVATDGVVPYDSAALGFGAEIVLDGGHDGHSDPAAIDFLRTELLNWAGLP